MSEFRPKLSIFKKNSEHIRANFDSKGFEQSTHLYTVFHHAICFIFIYLRRLISLPIVVTHTHRVFCTECPWVYLPNLVYCTLFTSFHFACNSDKVWWRLVRCWSFIYKSFRLLRLRFGNEKMIASLSRFLCFVVCVGVCFCETAAEADEASKFELRFAYCIYVKELWTKFHNFIFWLNFI